MHKASVIVVTYNCENEIINFLKSIYSNTDLNAFELIIFDNNSQDNTIACIKKFLKEEKRYTKNHLKLIQSSKNLGFGEGNNKAVEKAESDLLVLINPDTLTEPNWLRPILKRFKNDSSIGILGPKILYGDKKTIQSAGGRIQKDGNTSHYGYNQEDKGQYDTEREVDYVTGACLAVKKRIFLKCNKFDKHYFPAYYEETELCHKIKRLNKKVIYFPKSKIIHLESKSTGLFSKNYYYWYNKNRLRFVLKNYSIKNIVINFIPLEFKSLFKSLNRKKSAKNLNKKNELNKFNKKCIILKAYFYTLIKLPNIIYYRVFKYYQ